MHAEPRGDADKAFAAAQIRHEAEYRTPPEHHNPMEMYATTAVWDGGGKLTVYDKTQGVQNVQRYLCGVFDMKPEDLRVMSPYMGGGFGSGLRPQYNCVLAVLGARALQRSVRLALTRQQMYSLGYRPESIERLTLGARADGTLEALSHDAIAMTSRYEAFARKDATWGGALYKSPNTRFSHKLARLDVATPCDMRAPGATSGVYGARMRDGRARRCAQARPDRAAPSQLLGSRPERGPPLHQQGRCASATDRARRRSAGTSARREPRSMRDGKDLVGWGMATGIWEALDIKITARVVLTANGHAEVACATSDIGTGTYTVMSAGHGRHARPADRERHGEARRFDAAAIAGRRRIVDRRLRSRTRS